MLRRIFVLIGAASVLGATESRPVAAAMDAIGMTVSDLDWSVDFYAKVLSFQKVSEFEAQGTEVEHLVGVFGARIRRARLRLGDEFLELTEYLSPQGRPFPVDARPNDRSFQHVAIIVSDIDRAYQVLRANKVRHASPAPQRLPDWNKNAGGIKAFYFRDPDGHYLEILSFPQGKGDPKWQASKSGLFLGIDHTAIVISDTEASLRFYRDVLGLRIAGESENFGPEQERLNNVFGARLRITALRAGAGPGIELLEYLAPAEGRAYPGDEQSNDLIHWQPRLLVTSVDAAGARLRGARSSFISSGVTSLDGVVSGLRKAAVVRDPDGHALEIAER